MKKLLSAIALMIICGTAFGQAKILNITNTTGCTTWYVIMTSDVSNPCVLTATSSLISLAPGASVTYVYNTVPGLPPTPRYIIGARVYGGPPACIGTSFNLGEPCTGFIQFTGMSWLTANCQFCGQGYAKWVPAPFLGGTADLYFYP